MTAVAARLADHRVEALTYFLVAVAFVFGWLGSSMHGTHVVTQVRMTHPGVAQVLGHPTQSIAGAQISQALTGLTCDVYQAKRVVYCH